MSISSPTDRKNIRDALHEISGSMTRIDAEKDLIRETVAAVCEELKIPKKLVNRMVKVYHKQN